LILEYNRDGDEPPINAIIADARLQRTEYYKLLVSYGLRFLDFY